MTDGRTKSGKLGGKSTLQRHGKSHFSAIGKLGGRARRRKPAPDVFVGSGWIVEPNLPQP